MSTIPPDAPDLPSPSTAGHPSEAARALPRILPEEYQLDLVSVTTEGVDLGDMTVRRGRCVGRSPPPQLVLPDRLTLSVGERHLASVRVQPRTAGDASGRHPHEGHGGDQRR